MFKLGVIVPQSNFLPHLSRDLPIACNMALQQKDDVEFFFESGGFNEDPNFLKGKIQSLIIRENIDAILCPLNAGLIEPIIALCKTEEITLLVNTMGEDVIFDSCRKGPLFINSYQLWQSAWLTGYYAANKGYKDLAAVYSRHDGGYGVSLALAVGAEAGGANVKLTQVTHMESSDEDCTTFIRDLDKMQPDAIIAHHSGKEAVHFHRDVELAELESPLITLSPFVEDISLNQLGEKIEGTNTVSPFKCDTAEYQSFVKGFKAKTGRTPNPHVVMAYESVSLLQQARDDVDGDITFEKLVQALDTVKFLGPRGEVCFNPDDKKSLSKCYVREVKKDKDDQFYNKTVEEIGVPELCHEQYTLAQKNTQKCGWLNPYLIA